MDRRKRRIYQEIILLAQRFEAINYDDVDFEWVHIPRFELPPGLGRPYTQLLILLPAGYPAIPPDGFYLDKRLPLSSHYFQDRSHNPLSHKGWAWYCIHTQKASWTPRASILDGDNLLTYVELIRAVLTAAARGEAT
jgi:hypothetical protein